MKGSPELRELVLIALAATGVKARHLSTILTLKSLLKEVSRVGGAEGIAATASKCAACRR